MDPNLISGYIALAAVIIREVVAIFNHRRCRSNCCGRLAVVQLDVESTSPTTLTIKPITPIECPILLKDTTILPIP